MSVLDAFGSVHDILQQTDLKHAKLAKSIENSNDAFEEDLLTLKATSQAALHTMESALNILQDLRDLEINHVTRHYRSNSPLILSPKRVVESNNVSACGSPTRMSLGGDHHETLSVKSAFESCESKVKEQEENLSASTSDLNKAS